jgi:hypothetical protein
MSVPQSATSEMPSRTLTNRSVDEDAIPGEDTSEVNRAQIDLKWNTTNTSIGHEALRRKTAGLEACRRLPRRLRYRNGEDKPRTRQGVREGLEGWCYIRVKRVQILTGNRLLRTH